MSEEEAREAVRLERQRLKAYEAGVRELRERIWGTAVYRHPASPLRIQVSDAGLAAFSEPAIYRAPDAEERGMGCNCLDEIDKQLEPHGIRIKRAVRYVLSGGEGERRIDLIFTNCAIETERLDPQSRKAIPKVVATFCPFCGKVYEPIDEELADEDRED